MPNLRDALTRVKACTDPTGSRLALGHPTRLQRAVESLTDSGARPIKVPEGLKELYDRLKAANTNGTLETVSIRDRRNAPHIFSWEGEDQPLGHDPLFLSWYLRYFVESRKARDVRRLILGYFSTFAPGSAWTKSIGQALSAALERVKSPSLEPWRERRAKYGLFSDEACGSVASAFLDSTQGFNEFVQGVGVPSPTGPFIASVTDIVVTEGARRLSRPTATELEAKRLLEWLVIEGKLRYDDVRSMGSHANTLLGPWVDRDHAELVRARLFDFFMRFYGHPRLKQSNWQYTTDSTRAVINRWNARSTIEDFFKILDASAPVQQWVYRSAFWLSYVNRHHVFEAWPVFGKTAAAKAKSMFSGTARAGQYATLTGAEIDQSVLLIKIDNLTIVEWSSNGKCWIMTHQPKVPVFYRNSYSADDLRGLDCPKVTHYGKESGTWQHEVQQIIFNATGIRMASADYMPRIGRGL